jgi:copper chaperone CopZ
MTQTFLVQGMSCDHCVGAVTAEITKLPRVERVDVDLASGHVTVVAKAPLSEADIAAAVDEAGYELVHESAAAR